MGGRASSSKRKSKRDKISSKHLQKKSKRKESKKRHRDCDSADSSSDDDSFYSGHSLSTSRSNRKRRKTKHQKRRDSSLSTDSDYQYLSSDSGSASKDENDYKIRKARRSRVGLKNLKRKGRKKSTSTIDDVDVSSGQKRKRGRDHDNRSIKKSLKKKPKKGYSSSSGSDSESCSAYQSGSYSSSTDDKRQSKRVVSEKGKGRLGVRRSGKGKQKHKDRSPSCTSIGKDSNPGFTVGYSDEEFFPVDYSRRLRSVIVVVDQIHNEEQRWEKDPHKEEIVYDQNECPSPKSLDSNEDGTKMNSDNQLNVLSNDRICIENIPGEEVCELGKSGIDESDHRNAGNRLSEGDFMKYSEKEKEIEKSVPVAALGGDALETILRQKAFENLRKFRERPEACKSSNMMRIKNETTVASFSCGTIDTIQNVSIEQGSSDAQEINKKRGLLLQTENAEVVKLRDSEHVEKKPGLAKLNIMHPCNDTTLIKCSEENKSACPRAAGAKAVSESNTSPGAGGTKVCSSSTVEPASGEHSSEQGNEAKDSSQFEQKTMSVMRGGELVQVSYKVYIPNKAHTLARRQLRR